MSAVLEITEAYAEGFDAEREVLLGAASLLLSAYTMEGGTETKAEVASGWLSDPSDKGLIVQIVESAPLVGGGTLTAEQIYSASRVVVDDKTYKIKALEEGGISPPLNAPRLWTIRCGAELRTQP